MCSQSSSLGVDVWSDLLWSGPGGSKTLNESIRYMRTQIRFLTILLPSCGTEAESVEDKGVNITQTQTFIFIHKKKAGIQSTGPKKATSSALLIAGIFPNKNVCVVYCGGTPVTI